MGRAEDKRQAARDAAAHHGLKAAVPHYLEAAQALVEGRRPEEAVDLLGELLVAQEKKRGLFSRVDKNPLGPARPQVAVKFAEYSRVVAPTEDVLELLSQLSLENPDDLTIRRANADALYNAGYIADATEEYRYCLHLSPDDGQILSRLTDAYAEMGRNDHAIEFLRRGMRVHADAKDYGQAMHLAIRWLGMAPGAAEDVLILLKDWPADALRRQIGGINQLAMLAKKDDARDASWHKSVAAEFAALGASGRPELVPETGAVDFSRPTLSAPSAITPSKPAAPLTIGAAKPAVPPAIAPAKPAQPAAASAPAATGAKPASVGTKPADVKPTVAAKPAAPAAPPTAKPVAPLSEQMKIYQPQRPTIVPTTSRPVEQQRPAQPSRPAPAQSTSPAAGQAAPPAAPRPAAPLPPLEKVLEEADKRKPVAAPEQVRPAVPASSAPASAAKPPADVKPAPPTSVSAAPLQRPASAEARPTPPPVPPVSKPADAKPADEKPAAEAKPTAPEPTAAAAAEPAKATAGGTAAGIKNFARRKAKELYDAGDFASAVASLERVARFGEDAETLQMLLNCYAQLNQPDDAKRVGMRLAELEVEAGRVEAAVAALTTLAKTVPDPDVLKRRNELLSAKK